MRTSVIFLLLSACLYSCNFIDDDYSVIPTEAKPHVDEFFRIAKSKGLDISSYQLKIYFTNLEENGQGGNANLDREIINIDTTTTSWFVNPESVMFHELGHLYLHRGHDDRLINGNYKSIMNSWGVLYSPEERNYYIDELFDTNTEMTL